jgi:hypothetical protein
MIPIPIPIIICGEYGKGSVVGQLMAQVYVNYLGDDPQHLRQPWLPKTPMGLEEFFELNIKGCGVAEQSNRCYQSGAWHGFLSTVMLFRRFKVKTISELEKEVENYIKYRQEEHGYDK